MPILSPEAVPTLEALYILYASRIARHISAMVRNHEDVEDLTQETFFKAGRALPALKTTEHLYGWLATIATNTVRDAMRSRACRPSCSLEAIPAIMAEYAAPDPLEAMAADDCFRRALQQMTPAQVETVQWLFHGYRYHGIVRLTGLTTSRINGRIYRARQVFKHRYQQEVNA